MGYSIKEVLHTRDMVLAEMARQQRIQETKEALARIEEKKWAEEFRMKMCLLIAEDKALKLFNENVRRLNALAETLPRPQQPISEATIARRLWDFLLGDFHEQSDRAQN